MKPSRTSMLIAGIALILLTNAIVLGSVAYNRIGDPDSLLTLTERELTRQYDWSNDHENSGQTFSLNWRTLTDNAALQTDMVANDVGSGAPPWLDSAKLIALGFDAQPHINYLKQADKSLPRKVLLVLEWNGPAYQRSLQRIKEQAAREDAFQVAHPGSNEIARRAYAANQQLNLETNTASRLFVVDAGLDAAQLRSSYPDRTRYAIVPGEVHSGWIMNDNLLGNRNFCPVVRKTEFILRQLCMDFTGRLKTFQGNIPLHLFRRAIDYLYFKESKSSYDIERETAPPTEKPSL